MFILDLPFPPTVNTYYRNVGGKMLISKKGREYANQVSACVLQQNAAKMLEGRLSVTILVFPPDKRRRDLDNLLKSTLDSLTKSGVWLDDSQIDALTIIRMQSTTGKVSVKVEECNTQK